MSGIDETINRTKREAKAGGVGAVDVLAPLTGLKPGASIDEITKALRQLVEAVKGQDGLARYSCRLKAVQELERLEVKAPGRIAEEAFNLIAGGGDKKEPQGRSVIFEEVEPWSDSVEGWKLLDDLTVFLSRFLVLPKHGLEALALYVLFTYVFRESEICPNLALKSPKMRSGKTTAMALLSYVVDRPLMASNASGSVIFRSVEKFEPSLLIDECDSFVKLSDELRGILNSGMTRRTAFVLRTEGEEHEPRRFSTFCPKVFAYIGKLPATIEDRSITLNMMRKKNSVKVEQFREKKHKAEADEFRRKILKWANDNLSAFADAEPTMPEALNDRAKDSWRPLVKIANLAGGEWPRKAREAALALSGEGVSPDDGLDVLLLADLRAYFAEKKCNAAFTNDILKYLNALPERPWPGFTDKSGERKGIASTQIAWYLKPFGIAPEQIRIGEDTKKGYTLEWFSEAFDGYLPPVEDTDPQEDHSKGKQGKQTNGDAGSSDSSEGKQSENVSGGKSGENQHEQRSVSGVSGKNPESVEEEERTW